MIDNYIYSINLINKLNNIMSPKMAAKFRMFLDDSGFFNAPASSKYHLCCEAGLLQHSLNVYKELMRLTKRNHLKWSRKESPIIIGLFHDLCKFDNYIKNLDGTYSYNEHCNIKGHGDKSVLFLKRFFDLTPEEEACILYHMGAFTDKDKWNEYTNAIHEYPNVLWTHQADMIATHIDEKNM